jgi:Zn-finger nucleic acid-binding protein
MNCPRCSKPMRTERLHGHLGRDVDIDLCVPCQSLWYDTLENVQLTPGATLALFRLIGEHVGRPAPEDREISRCPRCNAQLRRTRDLQRATHFEYFRCPNQHGRLITFFDFLKEKDFVKPLTPQQIAELRKNVQTVTCSGCGAPLDLATRTDCSHCGAPICMLDVHHAEHLIAELKAAEQSNQGVDPELPLKLAQARQQAEAAFEPAASRRDWDHEFGQVAVALRDVIRLIKP